MLALARVDARDAVLEEELELNFGGCKANFSFKAAGGEGRSAGIPGLRRLGRSPPILQFNALALPTFPQRSTVKNATLPPSRSSKEG